MLNWMSRIVLQVLKFLLTPFDHDVSRVQESWDVPGCPGMSWDNWQGVLRPGCPEMSLD